MNKEDTKKARDVMTAFIDGAEIECCENGKSHDPKAWKKHWGDTPCWNFADYTYRIKPKPREFWITQTGVGNATAHSSEQAAIDWSISEDEQLIKVREVIK